MCHICRQYRQCMGNTARQESFYKGLHNIDSLLTVRLALSIFVTRKEGGFQTMQSGVKSIHRSRGFIECTPYSVLNDTIFQ